MKITNVKYAIDMMTKKNTSITIVVDGDTMSVPIDPENTHYQAILKWVAEGNTIEESD